MTSPYEDVIPVFLKKFFRKNDLSLRFEVKHVRKALAIPSTNRSSCIFIGRRLDDLVEKNLLLILDYKKSPKVYALTKKGQEYVLTLLDS